MQLKIEDESKYTKKITKRNNQIYQPITNLSINETNKNEIKKEDNIKISIIKLFFEIIALPYLLIGRYLYIISLKGCDKTEYDCLFDIQYIIDDINNCVQSTFYFIFVLFLIQMNLCSKYYLIVIFAFFAEFIITDRGSTFSNHGILNILGFFVILSFGEIIILIVVLFYKLYRCKNRIPFFFSVIIFVSKFGDIYP